jgi:hypothetical protein
MLGNDATQFWNLLIAAIPVETILERGIIDQILRSWLTINMISPIIAVFFAIIDFFPAC